MSVSVSVNAVIKRENMIEIDLSPGNFSRMLKFLLYLASLQRGLTAQ